MKMKKIFILSVFATFLNVVSAQTNTYDVRVYTNPQRNVEYTPNGGSVYKQQMEMYQQADKNALERERLQLERERMQQAEMYEMAKMSAATNAEAMKIVSDEVKTFNGTNLATKAIVPIRARVVKRNNGVVNLSCLGIKVGDMWKPCEKPISSLQDMYKSATSDDEKSMALGLMDLGNYLLDTGTEIYILK